MSQKINGAEVIRTVDLSPIGKAVLAQQAHFEANVGQHLSRCESPIEALFMLGIMNLIGAAWVAFDEDDAERFGTVESFDVNFFCQYEVEARDNLYRLDFALVSICGWNPYRIAIELDGHEFHERTKEQATRDKARDRALAIHGWTVLRFTGSEVWADVRKCVDEVADLLGAQREHADRQRDFVKREADAAVRAARIEAAQ